MRTLTHTDNNLTITLVEDEQQIWLELRDLVNDVAWPRVPLLYLEVYAKAEFRVETLRKYRIDEIVECADGFHISIGDSFRRIRIGLWVRLIDGELSVQMPMAELYEEKSATQRLFSVILLPGLIRSDSTGALLLPLNSGYLSYPADKPKLADRFMIYGEQYRWELLPTIPVCGAQSARGGLMALARQGACETQCDVATDGAGNGEVGFSFCIRQNWPDPVEFDTREIRYAPIPAKSDLVHFAAKRLRRHVMDDLGKPTLAARAAESPEVAYLLKAHIMKLFFAVENVGIFLSEQQQDNPLSFKRVMTFAQAADLLSQLHDAGIDKILIQSVGWNPRGHDGMWPTRFPIDERLGGEAGFRKLVARCNELGYQINAHDNHTNTYRISPSFCEELVIHDIFGEAMGVGENVGGTRFKNWVLDMPEERVTGEMRRVKALGLKGAGYLDGMPNPLYRNYHPRHRGTRTDFARGTVRLLQAGRLVYGAIGTECGFLYGAIDADSMVTCGNPWHAGMCWPEWPATQLMDKLVPVWQLAMHGLIVLENHGEDWPSTMEAVLFGDHPRTEWSAEPGVMSVLNAEMIAALKARHDLLLGRFGYLQTLELLSHREVSPKVFESTFEDGTVVVADFAKETLLVNGEPIARPEALPGKVADSHA